MSDQPSIADDWAAQADSVVTVLVTEAGFEYVPKREFDALAQQLAKRDAELGPLRGLLILAGDLRQAWADFDDANLDYAQTPEWRAAKGHLDGTRIAFEAHLSTIEDAADRAAIDAALADPANAGPSIPLAQVKALTKDEAVTP